MLGGSIEIVDEIDLTYSTILEVKMYMFSFQLPIYVGHNVVI